MSTHEEKEYVTQEKYDELKKELEFLKTVRRQEVAEELEYARSLGDLSENAEYQEARDQQGKVEDRILKIESILKNATILAPHHSDNVEMGSVVTVQKEGDKNQRTFYIVGSEEADTAAGKISAQSPLGQALMGRKKGEDFTFTAPAGEVKYKVVSIK